MNKKKETESSPLVQKSRPLLALCDSKLTLTDFKILDAYLAKINSHRAQTRTVTLQKGEIEKILGIERLKMDQLKKALMHLMQQIVVIPDRTEEKGVRLVTLFEEADAKFDQKNGCWKVCLTCTQKAEKYFFNIDDLGYLRYRLHCISAITHRYTYLLFLYIEANRHRGTWTVPVDILKEQVGCGNQETYREFKHFNNLILKKAQEELTTKTACKFTYEPIKNGRAVTHVRLSVKAVPELRDSVNDILQRRDNVSEKTAENIVVEHTEEDFNEIDYSGEIHAPFLDDGSISEEVFVPDEEEEEDRPPWSEDSSEDESPVSDATTSASVDDDEWPFL